MTSNRIRDGSLRAPTRSALDHGAACVVPVATVGLGAMDRVHAIDLPEGSAVFALLLIAIGVVLRFRLAVQRSRGYATALPRDRPTDPSALRRALTYEAWVVWWFIGVGAMAYLLPSGLLEFGGAVTGYLALILVSGRINVLCHRLNLPSVSAAVLESKAAHDVREAFGAWPVQLTGIGLALRVLATKITPGKASGAMSGIALLVASVAMANSGAAMRAVPGIGSSGRKPESSGSDNARRERQAPVPRESMVSVVSGPGKTRQPAPSPTYVDMCGSTVEPGAGAPSRQALMLRDLWLGPQGAGAVVAGCAERAQEVRKGSGVWYVTGTSAQGVEGLGIVTPTGAAALLLHEAARFALDKARDGTLTGASTRMRTGVGDLQLVDTTAGSFVLARAEMVAGNARASHYVVVPPGLVDIWIAAARDGTWTWPTIHRSPTGREFRFTTSDGKVAGTARCSSDITCVAALGHRAATTRTGTHITLDEVAATAPASRP
jgi:hypothetical protein